MLLPIASWLPGTLMVQFRLASEEEVHSAAETVAATSEVRRKTFTLPQHPKSPAHRHISARVLWQQFGLADRSEFRLLNGTGAALRC
jgi:hypothetical protein